MKKIYFWAAISAHNGSTRHSNGTVEATIVYAADFTRVLDEILGGLAKRIGGTADDYALTQLNPL
jgi:hypothetical protein